MLARTRRARLAAAVLTLSACVTTARPPFQAPPPAGPPLLAGEAAAKLLVVIGTDTDPQISPLWKDHLAKAAEAIEAELRRAGFRTTRERLARWDAQVTVTCPIRGDDFSVALLAQRAVVDRLEANGHEWGAAELGELARAVRQKLERSPRIAALAGVAAPPPAEAGKGERPPAPAAARAWLAAATAAGAKGSLAVLEFRGAVPPQVLALLADEARAAAVEAVRSAGVAVMTRERMAQLLREKGLPAAPCGDGACEVEAARALGADLVVTGEVTSVGSEKVLVLKLAGVASGSLLASKRARAAEDLALLEATRPAAAALFE